jgi:hypothetical protein
VTSFGVSPWIYSWVPSWLRFYNNFFSSFDMLFLVDVNHRDILGHLHILDCVTNFLVPLLDCCIFVVCGALVSCHLFTGLSLFCHFLFYNYWALFFRVLFVSIWCCLPCCILNCFGYNIKHIVCVSI